jgi:hypothetical protein
MSPFWCLEFRGGLQIFRKFLQLHNSRGVHIDYAKGCTTEDPYFDSGRSKGMFLFFTAAMAPGPTQPSVQCLKHIIHSRLKRPQHESGHSPLCSTEVENA